MEDIKFEVLHRERTDLWSFYGGLYSKDFKVGDTLTWLGHDGVFGYLCGEECIICTEEHLETKDNYPIYKKVGEYDIRTDKEIISKTRKVGRSWVNRYMKIFKDILKK